MQYLSVLRAAVVLAVLTQANAIFCACYRGDDLQVPESRRCCAHTNSPLLRDNTCYLGDNTDRIKAFTQCCQRSGFRDKCID